MTMTRSPEPAAPSSSPGPSRLALTGLLAVAAVVLVAGLASALIVDPDSDISHTDAERCIVEVASRIGYVGTVTVTSEPHQLDGGRIDETYKARSTNNDGILTVWFDAKGRVVDAGLVLLGGEEDLPPDQRDIVRSFRC